MKQSSFVIAGVLALTLTGIALPSPAGADPIDDPAPTDLVEVSETGSYIVVMDDDPLLADFDQDELQSAPAERQADDIVESHDEALEESGSDADNRVQSFTNALNGFSAVLSHDEATALATNKNVRRVMPDEMRQLETDSSPGYLGLTGRNGTWASGATGEGVVVGVIDSGIWPEHPSFADDGSYAAPPVTLDDSVRSSCEFGNTTHNPADVAFTCNNKLVGARQMLDTYRALIGAEPFEFDSARDENGHGTHTASTSAGNAGVEAEMYGIELGEVSGVAPRAHVIAYKGLGTLGGFGSDLAAAIDQAVADGVDVINYSVGGGPSLTGADDIAYLFAADAGVFVATSAGNSGSGPGTVGGPGSVPWITTVGASTQSRFYEGEITLRDADAKGNGKGKAKGKGETYVGASITPGAEEAALVDAEFAGGDLCIPGTLDPAAVAGNIVLCRRGAIGRADKSLAVSVAGGAGMILYNNTDDDNLFTDTHHVPSVHIDNTPGLEIKAYIASTANPTAEIETGETGKWKPAPSMTIFSSRGPNVVAEDIIKPDITAPGLQILAGMTPVPEPGAVPGQLFQAIAGTSMSSPHIAGAYALIKEVHPDWTPAMAKSAIMTTSHQKVNDNDRVSAADPFDMGAGHLEVGRVGKKRSSFEPGLVYDAGFLEYLGFLCDAEPSALNPTTCPFLDANGIPTEATDLNLASIGVSQVAGVEVVTRTVTSVANRTVRFRPKVQAPDGFDVSVSPRRLRLAPGETASYEVTIASTGAPVGEWRFGSLTWKGGGYKAYSPIAVKAETFAAPDAIEETGAAGTGSFDVGFGYSGDYTAAPHGLVEDTGPSDTISQDPDQTYPSGDDGAGGVNRHDFTVSGSALVRWKLQIPGDDDIDLFLEDSSGNIIAASTNGGTDELIELALPADDTYTMVVHGWSVPNEPLPYDLQFWAVPLTPGGSLSVDSAPASATAGTIGTIDYSWGGLASGDHVGAVSHSDAGGLLALTLIEVAVP